MKRKRGDKEAGTHKKKRKREKEDGGSAADGLKLLKYAALGEARKVEKLAKRRRSDIDAIDIEGSTALHQVPFRCLQVHVQLLPWRCLSAVSPDRRAVAGKQAWAPAGCGGAAEVRERTGPAEATPSAVLFLGVKQLTGTRAGTAQMHGLKTCEATLQRTLQPPRATLLS